MGIHYLDGVRFQRGLLAGIQRVITNQEYLNKINVFPVPDNDTGTNMASTLASVAEAINESMNPRIDTIGYVIAEAALDNARGNSGTILAQFFVGFAEAVKGKVYLTAEHFAHAVTIAKDSAYEALVNPQEGTILSVIKDWCEYLQEFVQQTTDIRMLLNSSLIIARETLKNTPKQLKILAKANVVDAGGQDFVDLLEGISDFIESGIIDKSTLKIDEQISIITPQADEIKYKFCTEFLVEGNDINRPALREDLTILGDSIILAGSQSRIKVHIHTNIPKKVKELCQKVGIIVQEKVENMFQQAEEINTRQGKIAIVVDSGCDLPDHLLKELNIYMVPIQLSFGNDHYIDKVTMNHDDFFKELEINPNHPKTSQPTPGDFRRMYKNLSSHYDSIISIHLPANSSGTYQSSLTAARAFTNTKITIIDSFSGTIGIGLIALTAAKAVKEGKSYSELLKIVKKAVQNTKLYIGFNTLEYIVRGGRLPRPKKVLANFLRLNPVITVTKKGKVDSDGITLGHNHIFKKLQKYVLKRLPNDRPYRIGIANALCTSEAESMKTFFQTNANPVEIITTLSGAALGVHSGPKAIAVAIQTLE